MHLTPAQIAVMLICGGQSLPPRGPTKTISENIREGHDFLVQITKKDFHYDLQAWHDYLKESRDGGYTYGRNISLPRIMAAALESSEWQEAVRSLEGDTK